MLAHRYQVINEVARGTTSAVLRALDLVSGRVVTVKRALVEPGCDEHLLRDEFRVLASIRHPNIVTALDFGCDETGRDFLVMDLHENAQSLAMVARSQPLAVLVDYLAQALRALLYLHHRGVLHRDINARNLLVLDGRIKLVDFGFAVERRGAAPSDERTVGTPAYMAPELLRGAPASEVSELYAIGLVAYEAFVGRYPLPIDPIDLYHRREEFRLPDARDKLDGTLESVFVRLLANDPAARFQSARHALDALREQFEEVLPETSTTRESILQSARFVGRASERAQFDEALRALHAGRGDALLVLGEAGSGKSRLIGEFETMALLSGVRVLRGHALEGDAGNFRLWGDVIRYCELLDSPAEPADGQDASAAVARAASRPQPSFIDIERILAEHAPPILIVLEDLHWAGSESLKLLTWLLRPIHTMPVLIVASCREAEMRDYGGILEAVRVQYLTRLSQAETAELASSILGDRISREVQSFLARETEGNPFFVVETIRALAEDAGTLAAIVGDKLPPRVLPERMRRILERRLARLADDDVRLLRLTATVGRDVDLELIRSMVRGADLDGWLRRTSDEAVLVITDRAYRFSHEKIREYLLETIDRHEKAQLYRNVAEHAAQKFRDRPEHAAELARYFGQAGEVGHELHYTLLAAEHELLGGACDEARQHFEHARELLAVADHEDARDVALPVAALIEVCLADCHHRLGNLEACSGHAERGLTMLGYSVPRTAFGYIGAILLALFKVVGRLEPKPYRDDPRARHLARTFMRLTSTNFYALRQLPVLWSMLNSVIQARRIGASLELAQTYSQFALMIDSLGMKHLSQRISRCSLLVSRRTGDLAGTGWVLSRMAVYRLGNCDWRRATREAHRAERYAEKRGDLRLRVEAKSQQAMVDVFAGRFRQGVHSFIDLRDDARRTRDRQIECWGLQGEALCLARLGQLERAREQCEATLGMLNERYTKTEALWSFSVLSMIAFRGGENEIAVRWVNRALVQLQSTPQIAYWMQPALHALAETTLGLEQLPAFASEVSSGAVRTVMGSLRRFARRQALGAPMAMLWTGVHQIYRGRLERGRRLLATAVHSAARCAMPYDQAWASLQLGRALDDHKCIAMAADAFERLECSYELQWARGITAEGGLT
ncbi:MAG: AAA family ATPase [Gammaproteobacteria bacterium]|nr:AAA family ATPase [Gammaproteobacteria bacterium]